MLKVNILRKEEALDDTQEEPQEEVVFYSNTTPRISLYSFVKLPSGFWGVKGPISSQPGMRVVVIKKDGTRKKVTLGRMSVKFDNVALYAIKKDSEPALKSVDKAL